VSHGARLERGYVPRVRPRPPRYRRPDEQPIERETDVLRREFRDIGEHRRFGFTCDERGGIHDGAIIDG
jgi:hypothetical protein